MQKNNEFEFQENVEALVQTAIFEMSSIIFVIDATQGILPADQKIAQLLRRKVPEKVVVVVNKADNDNLKEQANQFIKLGQVNLLQFLHYMEQGFQNDRASDKRV